MKRRPPPIVTTVAKIVIVFNALQVVLALGGLLSMHVRSHLVSRPGLAETAYVAVALAGALVGAAAGMGMLRGHNWARWLYVVGTPLVALLLAAVSHWRAVGMDALTFLIWLSATYYLFRPTASAFFAPAHAAAA